MENLAHNPILPSSPTPRPFSSPLFRRLAPPPPLRFSPRLLARGRHCLSSSCTASHLSAPFSCPCKTAPPRVIGAVLLCVRRTGMGEGPARQRLRRGGVKPAITTDRCSLVVVPHPPSRLHVFGPAIFFLPVFSS